MANNDAGRQGRTKSGIYLLCAAGAIFVAAIAYNALVKGDGGTTENTAEAAIPPSIEQLRRAAEATSGDAGPWQELGFAYFERGEFVEAVKAYERAVAIDDGEAVLWSALGEARVMASERDPMPPAALEAFTRANQLDPRDPRARYFLNVQNDLAGDHTGAIAGWLALLAETPVSAPWEADLVRTIEQVGKLNGIEVELRIESALAARSSVITSTTAPTRGPSQAEIAAAAAVPPGEQRAMAEGMVARLEERLRSNPTDPAGWVMLIRSRMTLGDPDLAREALEEAVRANPADAAQLRREAEALGVR